MGRKAKFDEAVVPSGPGRKAKKQRDPKFPKELIGEFISAVQPAGVTVPYICLFFLSILSKRTNDSESQTETKGKKKGHQEAESGWTQSQKNQSDQEGRTYIGRGTVNHFFLAIQFLWSTLRMACRNKSEPHENYFIAFPQEEEEEEYISEDETHDEDQNQQPGAFVRAPLPDSSEEESDDDADNSEQSADDDEDGDDDELPIEKANRRLKIKQAKERWVI